MIALLLASALAITPQQVRDCLDINDVPCAEAGVEALGAASSGNPELLALAARTAFFAGDYPEAYDRIQAAVQAGWSDRWQQEALYQRTLYTTAGWVEVPAGRFGVRIHPGPDAVLLDAAADVLQRSETNLVPLLGEAPPGKTLLEVHPDSRSFIAASSLSKEDVWTTGTIALSKWSRLLITSPRSLGRGYGWTDTIAHEYIHLVVAHNSADRTPVWLQEAIAKYLDNRWRDGQDHFRLDVRQQGLLSEALAHDDLVTFEEMSPSLAMLPTAERAGLAYAQLATLMDFCFQRGGEDVLLRTLPVVAQGVDPKLALANAAGFEDFEALRLAWRAHLDGLDLGKRTLPELPTVLDGGDEIDADPVMEHREDLARYLKLGDLLRERHRLQAAMVEYEKARAPDEPDSPLLANRRAQTLLELHKPGTARVILQESLVDYPEFTLTHKTLGAIDRAMGDADAARAQYAQALEYNPFDPAVQTALSELAPTEAERAHYQAMLRILRRGGDDKERSPIHQRSGSFELPSRPKASKEEGDSRLLGKPAPSLRMQAVEDGHDLSLRDYRGKVVLLDFWATWCGPCVKSMPELTAMQQRHPDDLVVIGISDESAGVVKRFLRKSPVGYPIATAPDKDGGERYGVAALPTAFVIDRAGVIQQVFVGGGRHQAIEAAVVDLIGGKTDRD